MEKEATVICLVAGFLGLLSAALGFAAEATRIKDDSSQQAKAYAVCKRAVIGESCLRFELSYPQGFTDCIHPFVCRPNMAADSEGMGVVIMGVSGAGKSTIGEMLAKAVNCSFLDADDFHPQSNKEKMHKGIPLSDEDRIPWLNLLRDALRASLLS